MPICMLPPLTDNIHRPVIKKRMLAPTCNWNLTNRIVFKTFYQAIYACVDFCLAEIYRFHWRNEWFVQQIG